MGFFTVSWLDLNIRVQYDDEFDVLNFSKYYFEPWYDITEANDTKTESFIVEIKNDTYKNDALHTLPSETITMRGTKDPLWKITASKYASKNVCVYEINERNAFLTVEDKKTLRLYISKDDNYRGTIVYQELFILIIDSLFIKYAESKGGLLFHAAAYGNEKEVCLIIGERGAGKTTTLLSAIRIAQNSCIANDRCLLMPKDDTFLVYGLPYTINIRQESLSMFKDLNISNRHIPAKPKDKIVFQHKEIISKNLKCGILKRILLPNCIIPNETRINRAIEEDAQTYLFDSCHSYKNVKFADWHSLFKNEFSEEYKLSFIENIVNRIPVFNLDWGKDLTTSFDLIVSMKN